MLQTERREDWLSCLTAFIASRQHAPFVRGENDCALFFCDAVKAMTDVDIASDFRGQYTTKEQAYEMLAAVGCQSLRDILIQRVGQPYPNVKFAKRGDAVLMPHDDETITIGLVDTSGRFAVAPGDDGLIFVPAKKWLEAWSVGNG